MGSTSPPSPTEMLRALEDQLRASLEVSRSTFSNPTNKGNEAEAAARDFLSRHLPRHLSVGNGEIIDTRGQRSGQVDVVISNEDQPFVRETNDPCLYLVEGVSAAAEVKAYLAAKQLKESLDTAGRVKELRPKPGFGDERLTSPADAARFYEAVPFFLLAFDVHLLPRTIAQKISQAPWVAGSVDGKPNFFPLIDAIFMLGKGALIYFGEGEAYGISEEGTEDRRVGWVFIKTDATLVEMLGWLSAIMPRYRRFKSIAPQYLSSGPRTTYHYTAEVLGLAEMADAHQATALLPTSQLS